MLGVVYGFVYQNTLILHSSKLTFVLRLFPEDSKASVYIIDIIGFEINRLQISSLISMNHV